MSSAEELASPPEDVIELALAQLEDEFERNAGEIIVQESLGVRDVDTAAELLRKVREASPGMLCTLSHDGSYYRVHLVNVRRLSSGYHSAPHVYAADRRDILRDWAFTRQDPALVKLWNSGMIEDFDTALATADFLQSCYPEDSTIFAPKQVYELWCLIARTYQLAAPLSL